MFDITTARQVDYSDASGETLQVTIFQDRTDKGIWYLVPVPRLRIDQGQPAFSLTKYLSKGGGISGSCAFEVELHAPDEAKRAAEQQVPGITGWGQFTWVRGLTCFDFTLPDDDGVPKAQEITITPSLFGTNTAHFHVELKTEAQLNSFKESFSGEGGLSPFAINYDMGVLTQLLGAEATIQYTASAAIEYERKYGTTTDTWGKKHTVLTEIKQNLKQSGAGEVTVKRGAGGTDELVQMVRDWAWSTLENQIADAVETARHLADGNENPISVVSDFSATYSEDTIVEWSTPVSRFLPRFDAATWSKLYHEVDNRQLVVTFELVGDPTDEDHVPQFEDVIVTVNYPTRKTDNTFHLSLKDNATSVTYVAPGGGVFDPNYEYRYEVRFGNGDPSYTSDWIPSSSTRVSFRPSQLGIRNVTFIGSGIPFSDGSKNSVNKVFIDFYETPPTGQKPKLQTKELTENNRAVAFSSTYHVPVTNTYNYRLRYQLTSGDIVTVQPNQQFGSDNADLVYVLTPQEHLSSFSLRAIASRTGDGFLEINANAAYFDYQNPSLPPPPDYTWDSWVPEPQPGLSTSTSWTFMAQPDVQTAYFQLNGQVIYGDGSVFPLVNINVPYSRGPLIVKDSEEIYSVEIFTNQIDWTQVMQVTLNIFQKRDIEGRVSSEVHDVAEEFVRAVGSAGSSEISPRQLIPYNILPPADDAPFKSLPLYYTVNKSRSSDSLVFYYNGDYVMRDGTVRSISDVEVDNKLQIHLPPVADQPLGLVHACKVALGS